MQQDAAVALSVRQETDIYLFHVWEVKGIMSIKALVGTFLHVAVPHSSNNVKEK